MRAAERLLNQHCSVVLRQTVLQRCQPAALTSLLDFNPAVTQLQSQQRRGLQLFDIFKKEAREKRAKRLKEDLQKGAFDDFRELKYTKGKLWTASKGLLPAHMAQPFPSIKLIRGSDKSTVQFPEEEGAPAATLVCVGFKAGSEEMLGSWIDPFVRRFGSSDSGGSGHSRGGVRLVELSIVESRVMALWPFRNLIMRASTRPPTSAATSASAATAADVLQQSASEQQPQGTQIPDCIASGAGPEAVATGRLNLQQQQQQKQQSKRRQKQQHRQQQSQQLSAMANGSGSTEIMSSSDNSGAGFISEYLFYFGDPYDICKALAVTNRLTGYAFLLDCDGRVRFRGCGHAEDKEVADLLGATALLASHIR